MKVEVNELVFIKLVESVKHCIAKDGRLHLQFIKLKITPSKLIAYACDGFRAARSASDIYPPAEEEFECLIKPIKIKPSKRGINNVVIALENNIAYIEVTTEFGKVKYCFEQPKDSYTDLEKVFSAARNTDRKIGINPEYVKQAMTALSQMQKTNKCVILECQPKANAAIFLHARTYSFESEQIILPMRIKGGAEE